MRSKEYLKRFGAWLADCRAPWRDKRLHALQIRAIARRFAGPALRGIVTLVSSINLGARSSFERLGFRQSGAEGAAPPRW